MTSPIGFLCFRPTGTRIWHSLGRTSKTGRVLVDWILNVPPTRLTLDKTVEDLLWKCSQGFHLSIETQFRQKKTRWTAFKNVMKIARDRSPLTLLAGRLTVGQNSVCDKKCIANWTRIPFFISPGVYRWSTRTVPILACSYASCGPLLFVCPNLAVGKSRYRWFSVVVIRNGYLRTKMTMFALIRITI